MSYVDRMALRDQVIWRLAWALMLHFQGAQKVRKEKMGILYTLSERKLLS